MTARTAGPSLTDRLELHRSIGIADPWRIRRRRSGSGTILSVVSSKRRSRSSLSSVAGGSVAVPDRLLFTRPPAPHAAPETTTNRPPCSLTPKKVRHTFSLLHKSPPAFLGASEVPDVVDRPRSAAPRRRRLAAKPRRSLGGLSVSRCALRCWRSAERAAPHNTAAACACAEALRPNARREWHSETRSLSRAWEPAHP